MNENISQHSQMYLNTVLQDLLVRSEIYTVNTLLEKCLSVVSDFIVLSQPLKCEIN